LYEVFTFFIVAPCLPVEAGFLQNSEEKSRKG
jgi:hypothetical protein